MYTFDKEYARNNMKWSDSENKKLQEKALYDLTNTVVNVDELSKLLERSPIAIRDQILSLRRKGLLPKKKKLEKKAKIVYEPHNLKYGSDEVKKQAKKHWSDVVVAADYIYKNWMTIVGVRKGTKDKSVVFIEVKNLNGIESEIKIEKKRPLIIIGNMSKGWQLARTW